MKNLFKLFAILTLTVITLTLVCLPASAAGFGNQSTNSFSGGFPEISSSENNPFDSGFKEFYEEQQESYEDIYRKTEDGINAMQVFIVVLIVIAVILFIAEVAYIFISAPKCGMSRLWALVPLFSNIFGLIVFIVVRSAKGTTASTHTITCPVCNGVHPIGTTKCSICGANL